MKIGADVDRCEGHGLCAEVAPEIFGLDDDAVVVQFYEKIPPELERTADVGANACPSRAQSRALNLYTLHR
jgi:ferredoxin